MGITPSVPQRDVTGRLLTNVFNTLNQVIRPTSSWTFTGCSLSLDIERPYPEVGDDTGGEHQPDEEQVGADRSPVDVPFTRQIAFRAGISFVRGRVIRKVVSARAAFLRSIHTRSALSLISLLYLSPNIFVVRTRFCCHLCYRSRSRSAFFSGKGRSGRTWSAVDTAVTLAPPARVCAS